MTVFLYRLLNELFVLSFFVLYLHASETRLIVKSHPSSRVNGYYPLDIRFTIRKEHLVEALLFIHGVDLGGDFDDCLPMIEPTIPPNILLDCQLISNGVQFTIDQSRINEAYEIDFEITFSQAKYNEEISPKTVTLEVRRPRDSITILNDEDWIPQHPAFFEKVTIDPKIGIPTCQLTTLIFALIPSVPISQGSRIELIFDSDFDFSLCSSIELNDIHIESEKLTGTIANTYPASENMEIVLKDVKRMSTVNDLYVKIKTYSLSGNIVHEEDVKVLIIPEVIYFPRSIILLWNKGVCSKGTYRLAVSSRCESIPNARYIIIPPSPLFSNDSIIISSSRNLNEEIVIEFELINPCVVVPGSILSKESFNLTVYNGNTNKPAFITLFQLPSNTSYKPGKLIDFKITPGYAAYGYETSYTFYMKNEHFIPQGGRITLTLNPFIELVSIRKVTINEVDTVITYSQGVISVSIPMDILPSTEIEIVIENLRNPVIMNIYSGFIANSFNSLGYGIDISNHTSIIIDKPGTATVTCDVNNKQSLEQAEYSFTFSSKVVEFSTDTILGIKMPKEINASTCSLLDNEWAIPLPNEAFDFWLKTKDVTVVDKVTILKFKFSCKNSATLKETDNFLLTLFKQSGHKILKGEVKVRNEKGGIFDLGSSIECDKKCPRCNSLCTLILNRKTDTEVRSIIIINDRLNLNSLTCKYEELYESICTAPNDKSDIRIKIISSMNRKTFNININDISIIYPDYSDILNYPVRVLTYTTEEEHIDSLVEDHQLAVIYGECDYPCKTCSKAHNICDTCTEDVKNGQPYHLYPEGLNGYHINCIKLEGGLCFNGYYKDELNKECRKCSENCKECEKDRDNCSKCKDHSKILYKGKCLDECGEGTYFNNNSCKSCSEGCKSCSSNTKCLECHEDYKFLAVEGECVLECPKGTYIEDKNCNVCDLNCAACNGTATNCIECRKDVPEKYLLATTGQCIDKATCEDSNLIADDSKYVCDTCSANCEKCRGRIDFCTKCKDNKYLNITEGICVDNCTPNGYNKPGINGIDGECVHCDNNCATCNTDIECITCIPNFLFIATTKECSISCPKKYYKKEDSCYPCNDLCEICGNDNECANCIEGYFLYKGQCYNTCPFGTYNSIDRICEDCDISCLGCESNKYSCIQCARGYFVSNDQCLDSCPQGTISINQRCKPCSSFCLNCINSIDLCTSCHGVFYLYENKCWDSCPENTTASFSLPKTCTPCMEGCKQCSWEKLNDLYPKHCITCLPGYKYYNSKCYLTCPEGYINSTNGLSCVKMSNEESSSKSPLPFPHLIAAGLFAFFVILKQTKNGRVLVISNLIVVLNYVAISCYIITFLYLDGLIRIAIFVVLALQLILNLIFLKMYMKYIASDQGFAEWGDNHCCIKYFILILSTIFSFQTARLFYSNFMGLEVLLVSFNNFDNVFNSFKRLSLVQIIIIQGSIIGFSIANVVLLDYGTIRYFLILESLILSFLLFVFIGYKVIQGKNIAQILKNYKKDNCYRVVEKDASRAFGQSQTKNTAPSYITDDSSKGKAKDKIDGEAEEGSAKEGEDVSRDKIPGHDSDAYIGDNGMCMSYGQSIINMSFLKSDINPSERDRPGLPFQRNEMLSNHISSKQFSKKNNADSSIANMEDDNASINEPRINILKDLNDEKNIKVEVRESDKQAKNLSSKQEIRE